MTIEQDEQVEHDLTLPEEVLLLALRDDAGTIPMGSLYEYAMGGAILAELVLGGRVRVEQAKRTALVQLADARLTGDPLLDQALDRIRKAKRRASFASWVQRLTSTDVRDLVARRLVQRGVLRRAEGKVLVFFSRKTWPTVDPRPEAEVVERMRRAIFAGERPDLRTAALIGLAHPSGLLTHAFQNEKKELRKRKTDIRRIAEHGYPTDVISAAVRSSIEATMAAVSTATMAATTAATMAATTAAT